MIIIIIIIIIIKILFNEDKFLKTYSLSYTCTKQSMHAILKCFLYTQGLQYQQ